MTGIFFCRFAFLFFFNFQTLELTRLLSFDIDHGDDLHFFFFFGNPKIDVVVLDSDFSEPEFVPRHFIDSLTSLGHFFERPHGFVKKFQRVFCRLGRRELKGDIVPDAREMFFCLSRDLDLVDVHERPLCSSSKTSSMSSEFPVRASR